MKKSLIKFGSIVIIILLIISLVITTIYRKREIQRVKNNLEIQLRKDFSRQQEITKKELKMYYEGLLDSVKNLTGVKPKQIEHIVQIKYNYVDSTVYTDSLIYIYDTIRNIETRRFGFATKCNYIEGNVIKDSITITRIEYTDDISIVLYKEKRRCFKPRTYRACAISSCRNDTISVSNNLHITKKCKK